MLPTLPNLYGLDVRFKYAERKIKEEKERGKVKSKHVYKSEHREEGADQPPPNRHARIIKKGVYVSPISYKV